MSTALVIHGHFYQPPRENPWTGTIDRQPSAHPFQDWNERIHHECYRRNAFARIYDGHGRIMRIINSYAQMSFNVGPTLLSWMEQHDPVTYQRILDADRLSIENNGGHGGAIAQAYGHAILPLCNERDRLTQIRWGIADFSRRFGREPAALWLPETACNDATLCDLIDHGMRFAILSPYQAERVRPLEGGDWQSVADGRIDPGVPYLYRHRDGSGRSLVLFFYDGPISRSIAFEGALASSQALVGRLRQAPGGEGRLIHIATDGESYGHHTRLGDLGLAYALAVEAPAHELVPTNYAAFLARHPPRMEAEIKAGTQGLGTAWSCAHGVGRWMDDCGCSTGAREGWNQAWRAPLRHALDVLRDSLAPHFEEQAAEMLADPWAARDAYVECFAAPERAPEAWLGRHVRRPLSAREQERALTLLEQQKNALLMYTSCGWFFADISGIETTQILRYAARAMDMAAELGQPDVKLPFLAALSEAKSNLPEMGNGADVYRRFVEPTRVSPARIAAHIAISGLVDQSEDTGACAGQRFRRSSFQTQRHGRLTMATTDLELSDSATGKTSRWALAAMHFGGVDFYCAQRPLPGDTTAAAARLWQEFRTAPLPKLLRVAREEFGPDECGLEMLLPEGRQRVSQLVFGNLMGQFVDGYVRLYEANQRIVEMLQDAGFELPRELLAAAEVTLGHRFEDEIRAANRSRDPAVYRRAIEISQEAARRDYHIDRTASSRQFGDMIADAVSSAATNPNTESLSTAVALVELAHTLHLDSHLDRAQELLHEALPRVPISEALQALGVGLGLAPAAMKGQG